MSVQPRTHRPGSRRNFCVDQPKQNHAAPVRGCAGAPLLAAAPIAYTKAVGATDTDTTRHGKSVSKLETNVMRIFLVWLFLLAFTGCCKDKSIRVETVIRSCLPDTVVKEPNVKKAPGCPKDFTYCLVHRDAVLLANYVADLKLWIGRAKERCSEKEGENP